MYSRPIKIYQGISNPIQVLVRNQDQKRVDLTGYALQADIQDPTNKITVDSFAVTWGNVQLGIAGNIHQGIGSFTIPQALVDSMDNRFYKLTFRTIKTSDNTENPVYVDDNYGVPLDLEVLPAYYAEMEPAPVEQDGSIDGGIIV